jgi:large subunit ribosomal protein L11
VAKRIVAKIKLQLPAGKANPSPPVGPALGQHGVNIMEFCKKYNAETAELVGQIIPVEIYVYEDRSFTYVLKTPPTSFLIIQAAGIAKGSAAPNTKKVGQLTLAQVEDIAKVKFKDTNAVDMQDAMAMVMGTAQSMGVTIAS